MATRPSSDVTAAVNFAASSSPNVPVLSVRFVLVVHDGPRALRERLPARFAPLAHPLRFGARDVPALSLSEFSILALERRQRSRADP